MLAAAFMKMTMQKCTKALSELVSQTITRYSTVPSPEAGSGSELSGKGGTKRNSSKQKNLAKHYRTLSWFHIQKSTSTW